MPEPFLSVVIPAYNEAGRIAPSLEKIGRYFTQRKASYELLVVDDGSSDNTAALVEAEAGKNPAVRLIRLGANQGKGGAVKRGMMEAKGDIIYFTDADLSTPIEEVEKFLPLFPAYDVVIGSRAIEGADMQIHEPFYREILGKLFNKIVCVLCVPGFVDTQCGAKMFKKDAARAIFPLVQTARFSFDVEVLFIAQRLGYKIKELPIRWFYSANTTVRTFSDGPKMLWDILLIRWIHRNTTKNVA